MDLNEFTEFQQLDTKNMLGEIDNLPQQLGCAWDLGHDLHLGSMPGLRQVVISGMGGSAIGADLVAAYISGTCRVPVIVHRDYGIPAYVGGLETLVIASSHSGNTEETLDSFRSALNVGCQLLVICTGGELHRLAETNGINVWRFDHQGQPRAAVGYSFGLLLSVLSRLELIPDPEEDFRAAIGEMRKQQEKVRAAVLVAENPAKRMAGQLVGRWVNVFAADFLAPVARRWKGQLNELAKAGAGFEILPEADHNALAGLSNPDILQQTISLFLESSGCHPRNRIRSQLTRTEFLKAGMNTDVYIADGDSRLAQMLTALHFGDYLGFYLAMLYGMDPTPVEALDSFKRQLRRME